MPQIKLKFYLSINIYNNYIISFGEASRHLFPICCKTFFSGIEISNFSKSVKKKILKNFCLELNSEVSTETSWTEKDAFLFRTPDTFISRPISKPDLSGFFGAKFGPGKKIGASSVSILQIDRGCYRLESWRRRKMRKRRKTKTSTIFFSKLADQ